MQTQLYVRDTPSPDDEDGDAELGQQRALAREMAGNVSLEAQRDWLRQEEEKKAGAFRGDMVPANAAQRLAPLACGSRSMPTLTVLSALVSRLLFGTSSRTTCTSRTSWAGPPTAPALR